MRCLSLDSYIKPQPKSSSRTRRCGCLSLDSYIKPQLHLAVVLLLLVVYLLIPTSNHNSRQLESFSRLVVYLLIPTSNHNVPVGLVEHELLFISWFLHQTTTKRFNFLTMLCCLSLDSYIKPQPAPSNDGNVNSCLSLDSYIKPQLAGYSVLACYGCLSLDSYIKPQRSSTLQHVVGRCLSLDSYIKPQPLGVGDCPRPVVYLLIPTSNHNLLNLLQRYI